MKIILKFIIRNLLCILSFFISQKNIIIIGGPDNRRYGGNVKYLYEFLSENTSYEVFWLTESEDIMKHLQSKNLRYLTNKNYLKKIITTLKCKYVIDSGTNFYNPFNYVSRMKKIIKITTMHGSGPKLTLGGNKEEQRRVLNLFDTVCFCTDYAKNKIGIDEFCLNKNIGKVFGQPKHDILRDSNYVDSIYLKRTWSNKIFNKQPNEKYHVIYYCPTWRDKNMSLPLEQLNNFTFEKFNDFLESNNIHLLYTEHILSNFSKINAQYTNIKQVTLKDYTLLDNLELLMESDMMITDYSTLSSDYSILKKPQLFIITDIEEINSKKGFIEDPVALMPGAIITEYKDLCKYIKKYIHNPDLYSNDYKDKLSVLKKKYIGPETQNSRQMITNYILSR